MKSAKFVFDVMVGLTIIVIVMVFTIHSQLFD